MTQSPTQAFQFKITLDEVTIPVWRRILVPSNYSFWDLHVAIQDQKHPEHQDMLEWVGGSFDPDRFDPREVHFDDPGERLKTAFE